MPAPVTLGEPQPVIGDRPDVFSEVLRRRVAPRTWPPSSPHRHRRCPPPHAGGNNPKGSSGIERPLAVSVLGPVPTTRVRGLPLGFPCAQPVLSGPPGRDISALHGGPTPRRRLPRAIAPRPPHVFKPTSRTHSPGTSQGPRPHRHQPPCTRGPPRPLLLGLLYRCGPPRADARPPALRSLSCW